MINQALILLVKLLELRWETAFSAREHSRMLCPNAGDSVTQYIADRFLVTPRRSHLFLELQARFNSVLGTLHVFLIGLLQQHHL